MRNCSMNTNQKGSALKNYRVLHCNTLNYEIPVAVILSLRRISANQTADSSQAQNDILRLGARPYTVIVVLNYAK